MTERLCPAALQPVSNKKPSCAEYLREAEYRQNLIQALKRTPFHPNNQVLATPPVSLQAYHRNLQHIIRHQPIGWTVSLHSISGCCVLLAEAQSHSPARQLSLLSACTLCTFLRAKNNNATKLVFVH
ncbi:hypothetical protein JZ751_004822 [Albula glossodonta]|uniref:Uncharacterized protein n=1 Tax=Albula glossodonta TaxID=121402 RepID=A0A8T2P3W7_9TELE|nr:hypothetical protein JZ751_004822 [Albula glossodonta]